MPRNIRVVRRRPNYVILHIFSIVIVSGGHHVDHPPHPHQSRSVRDRKRRADLEDAMRFAHDPTKGLPFGKALALPRRARIHLVLGMGERSRDRGLSQQRRPQGDRAAHARTERGEGEGQALRPGAIGPKRGGPGASPVPDSTWGALEFLEYPSSSDRGGASMLEGASWRKKLAFY